MPTKGSTSRVEIICEHCRTPFAVKQSHANQARFCSLACRYAQGAKVERICEECGSAFAVYPSKIERGKGRYCSRACTDKAAQGRIPQVRPEQRLRGPAHPQWKPEFHVEVVGYCACGCGQRTKVAQGSDKSRGRIKGQPMRYVKGHNGAKSPVLYREEDRGYRTPCWIWQRTIDRTGYAKMPFEGKTRLAHRVFYVQKYGAVPDGLELDHLCRQRSCVNPDHLEPVTRSENVLRGIRARAKASA